MVSKQRNKANQSIKNDNDNIFFFLHSDNGMRYMIGDDWRSLFDIVVVQARKPKFFTQQSRPFRKFNIGSDRMAWNRVEKLEKGKVYMEGTVFELLKVSFLL